MTKRLIRLTVVAVAAVAAASGGAYAYADQTATPRAAAASGPLVFVVAGQERCLDVPAESVGSHRAVPLQVWDCTGGDNQRFTFVMKRDADGRPTGTGRLETESGSCVVLPKLVEGAGLFHTPCGDVESYWSYNSLCVTSPSGTVDPVDSCDRPDRPFALTLAHSSPDSDPLSATVNGTDQGAPNGTRLTMRPLGMPSQDPLGLTYLRSYPQF